MATKYVIDTHTLLWYIADDPQLGKNAGAVLDDLSSDLVLPAIALAEACWIIERGKVAISLSELLIAIDNDARITFFPLTRFVIDRCNGLTAIGEMHDRQITATALLLADQGDTVAVLTKDGNITASGLVPIVW